MSAVAAVLPALALAQAPVDGPANTPWHTEPEPMTAEDKVRSSPPAPAQLMCPEALLELDSRAAAVLRPAGVRLLHGHGLAEHGRRFG